jgi:hypothetical protein
MRACITNNPDCQVKNANIEIAPVAHLGAPARRQASRFLGPTKAGSEKLRLSAKRLTLPIVLSGPVPGFHGVFVDGRAKPGHDE